MGGSESWNYRGKHRWPGTCSPCPCRERERAGNRKRNEEVKSDVIAGREYYLAGNRHWGDYTQTHHRESIRMKSVNKDSRLHSINVSFIDSNLPRRQRLRWKTNTDGMLSADFLRAVSAISVMHFSGSWETRKKTEKRPGLFTSFSSSDCLPFFLPGFFFASREANHRIYYFVLIF